MQGKVYLVGAGPGMPDLITVRGLKILKQAQVVIYDYLVDKRLLEYAKEGAELICCDRLGKKRFSEGFLRDQEKISRLIVKKAKEGKKVLRLRNGDSSIFSRVSQEMDTLIREKIEFEIVPGVTAASAASCFCGVPLTDRRFSSSVVFVTGHEAITRKGTNIEWGAIANSGTIVLYMSVENISKIADELIGSGKPSDTPVVAVSNAGKINQKTARGELENIAEIVKKESITPPAIFIIGGVAKLGKGFNWLQKSRRILFTGLSEERFFERGAYFHLPLIKITALKDYRDFDGNLRKITDFDWIVFASRFAVEYFFKRFQNLNFDSRRLNNIKIASIGSSTKNRLLDFGISADLVAKKESSSGLIEEFKYLEIKNKKIFLPRSDISDKGLKSALKELGAKVTSSFAYRNIMPENLPDLSLDFFDQIVFTSPSTVRNFKKRYGMPPKNVAISSIGEVTEDEVKRQFKRNV